MISENDKNLILATKSLVEFDKVLKSIFGDKPVSMADVGEEVISHMYKLNEQKLDEYDLSKKRIY